MGEHRPWKGRVWWEIAANTVLTDMGAKDSIAWYWRIVNNQRVMIITPIYEYTPYKINPLLKTQSMEEQVRSVVEELIRNHPAVLLENL